jgi:predicted nucleotidyltransferase
MSDLTTRLACDARIRGACERHGVEALYLFGSRTRPGEAREDSDVDLLVRFRSMEPRQRTDACFGVKDDLAGSIGVPVDLVIESAVTNPYVRRAIEPTKRWVHGG